MIKWLNSEKRTFKTAEEKNEWFQIKLLESSMQNLRQWKCSNWGKMIIWLEFREKSFEMLKTLEISEWKECSKHLNWKTECSYSITERTFKTSDSQRKDFQHIWTEKQRQKLLKPFKTRDIIENKNCTMVPNYCRLGQLWWLKYQKLCLVKYLTEFWSNLTF